MKVLIVDDNELARKMIKHYLQELSNQFCECEDGAEAVAAYAEFLPDWVLMDWEMKRVNGFVATRRIIADFPHAKILMVTTYDEQELRRAATEAGVQGFVSKDDLFFLHSFLKNLSDANSRVKL